MCYVPDNPWLASSHTTSRVGANKVGSILLLHHIVTTSSPHRHHTGLSDLGDKKQQQPTIYNLAWRDAHARTTQESHRHLDRTTWDPRRVRRAPSTANRLVQHYLSHCHVNIACSGVKALCPSSHIQAHIRIPDTAKGIGWIIRDGRAE